MARPKEPSSSVTSASRVGLPRLSRISRAWILVIEVMGSGIDSKGGFEETVLLGDAVQRHQRFEQRLHLAERPRVRTVAQRFFRLGMRFNEDAGDTDRHGRTRQHRD